MENGKVHHDAKFLLGLVTNDNIVRLLSIITIEGRLAGYGMERLYELHNVKILSRSKK